MLENAVISSLPKHLKAFIVDQNYENYTAQDHAVWRYVMRQNLHFLANYAHKSYLDGLSKTGISIDKIPSINEMNEILSKIGWAAVAVDGFIPPAAFMEFQKHNVLVIAADIRSIKQIEYTPAPDIIHEAAGHAPIIADPEYAEYLRNFGDIGSKAFSSKKDYELYEAIRHLSILKANPNTPVKKIEKAEAILEKLGNNIGVPSEMTLIRNLHWWTVEYGLIGDLDNPKIYGAGLLSSIGESSGAMKDDVIKIPYTIDAQDYSFDITKPQPQLFVTPDFKYLNEVLEEFANQMALRRGGIEGITKAIESGNTATVEYASGLQVSGTFTEVLTSNGLPAYIKTTGPTILCYQNKMLDGHTKEYHAEGYGSPVGAIKGFLKPTRLLTAPELHSLGIEKGKRASFEFDSGLTVDGDTKKILRKEGKLLLISFTNCTVKLDGVTLFEPDWGTYDMAIGEKIISAFNGPADAEAFGLEYEAPAEKTQHIKYSATAKKMHALYAEVREIREKQINFENLSSILEKTRSLDREEWLLMLEIFELAYKNNNEHELTKKIVFYLNEIRAIRPDLETLINNGFDLITSGK
ncbi:MAG TPA: aromatic amino acid hydroxylase [Bacteroidales bacterium]